MYSYKGERKEFVDRGIDSYTLVEITAYEKGQPAETHMFRHYPSGKIESDEAARKGASNIEIPMDIRRAIYIAMLP